MWRSGGGGEGARSYGSRWRAISASRLARVFSPTGQSTRHTPCSEIRRPPHFSRASSALILLGPKPG